MIEVVVLAIPGRRLAPSHHQSTIN